MQQHSSQHLITAIADQVFGFHTTSWGLLVRGIGIKVVRERGRERARDRDTHTHTHTHTEREREREKERDCFLFFLLDTNIPAFEH